MPRKKLTRGKFDRFFCIATFYCAAHFWGRAVLMAVIKVDLKKVPDREVGEAAFQTECQMPNKIMGRPS